MKREAEIGILAVSKDCHRGCQQPEGPNLEPWRELHPSDLCTLHTVQEKILTVFSNLLGAIYHNCPRKLIQEGKVSTDFAIRKSQEVC